MDETPIGVLEKQLKVYEDFQNTVGLPLEVSQQVSDKIIEFRIAILKLKN